MLDFSRVQNDYIACGYTDMRKQIDGLAALVQTQFGQEMDETSLYLFCGKRADRIKALYWDGTGYMSSDEASQKGQRQLLLLAPGRAKAVISLQRT